jgi:hypothetical protein
MASGNKEHRMVFDIRGKRRHVVKVVYAILALLMGASLFLVVGPVNIGSILGNSSESGNGAKIYEEQAERIERKLVKSPEDPNLLLSLTRAQLNAGNQLVGQSAEGQVVLTEESVAKYREASESWSKYLDATNEPSASGAQLIAPAFVTLAETSRTGVQFEENMQSAAEAAAIVAKQRPSINSLSTLSYYESFAFDKPAAEKARKEAVALTKAKFERENLENQLDEYQKRAAEVEKSIKSFNKQSEGSGAGKEALENPFGGLGGSSLGE